MRLLLPLLAAILTACTPLPQSGESVQEKREHPDITLRDASYTTAVKHDTITVHAKTITIDRKAERAELENLTFSLSGTTGRADYAVVNTTTYETELQGNIELVRDRDNFTLHTSRARWDNETATLTSPPDTPVTVSFEESTIEARGFSLNMQEGTYLFKEIEKGVIK